MNEVTMHVDGATFDPNRITLAAILALVKQGFKVVMLDYATRERLGYFISSNANRWGYAWVRIRSRRPNQ